MEHKDDKLVWGEDVQPVEKCLKCREKSNNLIRQDKKGKHKDIEQWR